MSTITILRDSDGRPTHAVLPWSDVERLGLAETIDEAAEDAADAALMTGARADDDGMRVPLLFVRRIYDGEHVVAVLRDWRGLSQAQLAERMGTTPNYISQIESRARRGVRQIDELAKALGVASGFLRGYL